MPTETSPLLLLMNKGRAALRSFSQLQINIKISCCPKHHRTEHLPESSGERFKRQSSKFHRGVT